MKTLVVGLTGGFATGKSTVAGILRRLGAFVIDTDRLAHQALVKGTPQYKKIVRKFGSGNILNRRGWIDRRKLGSIVFSDSRRLRELESILHPFVFKKTEEILAKTPRKIAVVEVPLLFETRFDRRMDKTVVVACSAAEQVKRAVGKHGLDAEEVRRRINRQMPLDKKKRKADFVIENNRGLKELRRNVNALWDSLNRTVSKESFNQKLGKGV